MTTIEAAGTTATALPQTTQAAKDIRLRSDTSTTLSAIDPTIVKAKSSGVTLASPHSVKSGGGHTVEQMVDSVVSVVVALIDVVVQVISLVRAKDVTGRRETVSPKPIPLLPNKKPATAPKPAIVSEKSPAKRLEAVQDDKGVVTVRTSDGYVVRAEGTEAAWTIAAPDGKTTRIFGDPHVLENDGDRWDFKQRGTFAFGANKVTVETVPIASGTTVSSRITLYSGGERVTIGGIDKNKPTILALAGDGRQHDDALSDGDIYSRATTKTGESWWLVYNGKKKVMGAR
jgi:hypothetical protein